MTNGEKFKEIFSITQVDEGVSDVYVWTPNHDATVISIDWWNAEYKEPTTKNDLGVDAVSRKDVHDMLENLPVIVEDKWFNWLQKACMRLAELPSVTPQEPRCKNCKWWKDSDGEYRRGCGAESKCPINRREVFEGNGYCYLYEPQESEE